MNPAIDGWSVLTQLPGTVLSVIGLMLWGAAVGIGLLRRHGLWHLGVDEILSLACGLWMPAGLLVAALSLILDRIWPDSNHLQTVVAVVALATLLWTWWPWRFAPFGRSASRLAAMLLLLALMCLLVWRLGYIRGLALPAYFDSATHFGLIQQLVQRAAHADWSVPLTLPARGYYHLGYHLLLAGLVRLTDVDIAPAMLISGQVLLATLPIALYLLAFRLTGSRIAGLLAVTFGAVGWSMPAHAVNWGKYPALFGLPAMLGAVSLAWEATRPDMTRSARRVWLIGAASCALASVLSHTRLGVVLIMASAAWVLSGTWHALAPRQRAAWAGLLLLCASALLGFITRDPIYRLLLEPFAGSGILATALVVLLLPWAYRHNPRGTFALVLIVTLLLAGLFVPGPAGGMLDRPLVQVLLPLPLSLLGAVGAAGLLQVRPGPASLLRDPAGVLLSAAVVGNALLTQGPGASGCCSLVSPQDLVALDWMRREAPADSRVAVATAPMQVSPGAGVPLEAGVDAGIWVAPLTGLSSAPLSFMTDFASAATHSMLCREGIGAVYAGDRQSSFDITGLLEKRQWYEPRLQLSGVSVFGVTDCTSG